MTTSNNDNNLQNWIICTSCVQSINLVTNNDEYYKCRQCAYHQMCKNCSQLPVNKGDNHQLIKIFPNNKNKQQGEQTVSSNNRSSSIFTDKNYLTTFLGYCDHCLNPVYIYKELSYKCDQCPDFLVCQKCISLMPTQHPSQHIFIKSLLENIVGQHIGITCDGCGEEHISGARYKCEQCHPTYDLCSKCFQQSKINHNRFHTFQLIQDPLIRYTNRKILAKRVLELFHRQNITNNDQHDPLTGWTKNDAEKINQQEDEALQSYKQQQESEKKMQDAIMRAHESRSQMFSKFLAKQNETTQNISYGNTCPKCRFYF